MENAKALLRVANHLDADSDKEPTEPLLFHGLIIVIPTLLGLATELALKALHMREAGTSPKSPTCSSCSISCHRGRGEASSKRCREYTPTYRLYTPAFERPSKQTEPCSWNGETCTNVPGR